MNFKYKPGMRVIKTAIAIAVCLILEYIMMRDSLFYAAIAAIICLQSTYDETKYQGLYRMIGTIIGGVVGYFGLELVFQMASIRGVALVIIAPVGFLIVSYILNVINKPQAIGIAGIVFLSIVLSIDVGKMETIHYVVFRVLDTFIGIIIAILLNKIFPPTPPKDYLTPPNKDLNEGFK